MKYLKIKWNHNTLEVAEPVVIYSELEDDSMEVRKVEVYQDGRYGFADKEVCKGGTQLSLTPLPSLEEINSQPSFQGEEITKGEFEEVWKNALDAE